jgi:uncharacterized sulfatase
LHSQRSLTHSLADDGDTMTRPNIVLIITDTQGANIVGAYGRSELQTPCLDALAAQGVLFERAYTATPLCTPARAALFTGRYPHNTGAWANGLPLGQTVHHMGQRFRDAGYRCAYSGKWHLDGHDYFGTGVCPDGWDPRYWFDWRIFLESLPAEERSLIRTPDMTIDFLQTHNITAERTYGHHVSNSAISFLEEVGTQRSSARGRQSSAAGGGDADPFLLVVSYDEPHDPHLCPPDYAERFADYRYPLGPGSVDNLADKPEFHRQWAASNPPYRDLAHAMHDRGRGVHHPLYFGANSFVDAEIGRVVEAIDRLAPENTWVVFTSDHGEMLGSHGLYLKDACVYDEICRVPLIVRPPHSWVLPEVVGTRPSAAVSHVDVLPTLLNLAGIETPDVLEGASLLSILHGDAIAAHDPRRAAFIAFGRYDQGNDGMGGFAPMRAVVRGAHKLVVNLLDTDELYDLSTDPGEVRNTINDTTLDDLRDDLHDTLINWMYTTRDPFRGTHWETRSWRRRPSRLTWSGGWTGSRRGADDGYAPSRLNYRTGLPA